MLISFVFSYSENFFIVFYLSFYFVLGQDPSARDQSMEVPAAPNQSWNTYDVAGYRTPRKEPHQPATHRQGATARPATTVAVHPHKPPPES